MFKISFKHVVHIKIIQINYNSADDYYMCTVSRDLVLCIAAQNHAENPTSFKIKIWSSTLFLFTFVCVYTNKYNMLCRFYVILFVIFTLKNTIVLIYFIASKFNKCQN